MTDLEARGMGRCGLAVALYPTRLSAMRHARYSRRGAFIVRWRSGASGVAE